MRTFWFFCNFIVDDVWSGGTAEEATKSGYLLMSECIKQGLYHPNCKDSHTTYFGDLLDEEEEEENDLEQTEVTPNDEIAFTPEEQKLSEQLYKAEQRENYCERQIQRFERLSKHSLSSDNKRMYKSRAADWIEKSKLIDNNKESLETAREILHPGSIVRVKSKRKQRFISKIFDKIGYKNVANDDRMMYTKIIKGNHSIEDDLKRVNPNYLKGEKYKQNCQRCVVAYEMRRRGFDVSAKPAMLTKEGNGIFSLINDEVAYEWKSLFKNPHWIKCGTNRTESTKQAVIDLVKQWGNGARAEIYVQWSSQYGGSHVFVAENVKGTVRFIDPQPNKLDVSDYFNNIKSTATEICRIDNLEIDDIARKCYE